MDASGSEGRAFDEWFPKFVAWLQGSLPLADWPRKQDPYWDELRRLMEARRVGWEEARDAVRAMFRGEVEVIFARSFPAALVNRVDSDRRATSARRLAERDASAAETMGTDAHQRACETAWATMDEPSREEWRQAAVKRFPFLAGKPKAVDSMAMAWAGFPADFPPDRGRPQPADFGPPLKRREPKPLRAVLDHDRILDGPPPSEPEPPIESTSV
jgi:hypothetical protein